MGAHFPHKVILVSLLALTPRWAQGQSAQNAIGFVGCSFSNNAVNGYKNLGGKRFWDIIPQYNGGSLSVWAAGVGSDNRYWNAFAASLRENPNTTTIWWQLCNSPQETEDALYAAAQKVLTELKRRLPQASIYASAQHNYSGGHVCRSEPDGPARMQRLAQRLAGEGLVLPGPVMGPLAESQTRDGCHANADGMRVLGQQLLSFFGETPAEAPPVTENAPPAQLIRREIDSTRHPKAVCNDGSTPIFYYRRGSGSGANKWVLWFKGGGSCYDSASCADRSRNVTSSIPWNEPQLTASGILSSDPEHNPDFYNWNHVLMVYCSSDQWVGAREDADNATGWYFRGHFITNAILHALMSPEIIERPNLREATHVLVTGSSAGAHGLIYNLDRIEEALPWADVRGASDADLGFAVNPALRSQYEAAMQAQYATWQPVLDESCLKASAADPAACFSTHLMLEEKYLSTPLFARNDLLDREVLDSNDLDLQDPSDRPLILQFATRVAALLRSMSGAFGTATGQHVMIETDQFNAYRVSGLSFADVLGNWYFNRPGPKVVIDAPGR